MRRLSDSELRAELERRQVKRGREESAGGAATSGDLPKKKRRREH